MGQIISHLRFFCRHTGGDHLRLRDTERLIGAGWSLKCLGDGILAMASRYFVGDQGWSLRMIAKNVGVSTARVARTPGIVKAQTEQYVLEASQK